MRVRQQQRLGSAPNAAFLKRRWHGELPFQVWPGTALLADDAFPCLALFVPGGRGVGAQEQEPREDARVRARRACGHAPRRRQDPQGPRAPPQGTRPRHHLTLTLSVSARSASCLENPLKLAQLLPHLFQRASISCRARESQLPY